MVKLTERQRDALQLLHTAAENMAKCAPPGKEDEYRAAGFFWAQEPAYCWVSAYGFSFQSMNSIVTKGLASRDGRNFRITDAGRAALEGE